MAVRGRERRLEFDQLHWCKSFQLNMRPLPVKHTNWKRAEETLLASWLMCASQIATYLAFITTYFSFFFFASIRTMHDRHQKRSTQSAILAAQTVDNRLHLFSHGKLFIAFMMIRQAASFLAVKILLFDICAQSHNYSCSSHTYIPLYVNMQVPLWQQLNMLQCCCKQNVGRYADEYNALANYLSSDEPCCTWSICLFSDPQTLPPLYMDCSLTFFDQLTGLIHTITSLHFRLQ